MTRPQAGAPADDAGRYVLESRIATGGMGEVWRARDTVLDRPVAVKVLKSEYADDALFRTRFETEARHAASLHHAGVAAVFDFGQAAPEEGSVTPRPYLVMELVEGQPLSALLKPGVPLDPEVARDLLAQAADALGAAHARGIVHRDVKPGNLIVTPDRRVKMTDFGIARAAEGMALTETGQVLGTPAYISPEQAEGRPASPASDVYSLGVVAFECLAGRKPFAADTPVATAIAHVRNPVPPLPDTVPPDLAAIVARTLSKDAAQRYADGSELAAALRSGNAGAAAPAAAVAPDATATPAATQVLPTAAAAPVAAPVAAAAAAPPPPPAPAERRTARPGVPWALVAALAAVVAAVLLAVWLGAEGDEPEDTGTAGRKPDTSASAPAENPSPSRSESQATEEPPEETPTETPSETATEPETVTVDPAAYVGRDHKDVAKELEDLGLEVAEQEVANPGDQGERLVASVEPSGEVAVGETVLVSYYGKAPDVEDESDEDDDSGNGKGKGKNR